MKGLLKKIFLKALNIDYLQQEEFLSLQQEQLQGHFFLQHNFLKL